MTPPAPPRHILAINDDPTILRLYAEMLTEEGYRVSTRLIPSAGLADVHAVAPDMIVLDLVLGTREWGMDLLTMLRADPATRSLPVLVCSAATERLAALAGELNRLDCGVIPKPFDIDDFLAAVRANLDDPPPSDPAP